MNYKNIIPFFIILVATHVVYAQHGVETSRGAVITFNTNIHDYDTILQGSNGTSLFTFVNSGDEPLIINHVTSSCGCTTPEWSKRPIMPGQKGTVTVNYNTDEVGVFRKTLVVHSNATNRGKYILRIKGVVLPRKITQ